MIPAIDPGIGLKEDRPAPQASPSGNPGFSKALQRATRGTDRAESSAERTRAAGDTRARERYGKATDRTDEDRQARESRESREAREGREPNGSGKPSEREALTQAPDEQPVDPQHKSDLQAAAQQAGGTALQAVVAESDGLAEAAAQVAVAGEALLFSDSAQLDPGVGGPNDATPIAAQLGTAAYRMGPHGNAEAALAEAQGLVLDGTPQARMLGKGINDVQQTSFNETDPRLMTAVPTGEAVADETDVLEPSTEAKIKAEKGLSYKEQIALQSAQARNEVLNRLTPAGEEQALLAAQGDALRQNLQLQGLLARNARAQAFDNTAPVGAASAAAASGLITPGNSVDLTQVFEVPSDDVVEQRLLERVANEARWLLRNDRQEVSFRLHPEHLGSMQMKVLHKDGVFRVEMMVDNLNAKHLLESNLQDLRQRLAGDNPDGEFLFNVDVRQGNEQPSLYARPQRDTPRVGRPVEGLEDQSNAPGLAGRVMSDGRLSIYA